MESVSHWNRRFDEPLVGRGWMRTWMDEDVDVTVHPFGLLGFELLFIYTH